MRLLCLLPIAALALASCGSPDPRGEPAGRVVVYTSVDRVFAEPVLRRASDDLGIDVVGVYDTEETKSTGLVNRLLARRDNPDGDIFWSGDPGRAALLKTEGVTEAYASPAAEGIPSEFMDADRHWIGFSARARVLLVNTGAVAPGEEPKTLEELTGEKWRDRAAIANPLFGTTSYHVAALFEAWGEERAWKWLDDLKANGAKIASSNGDVKRQVASGQVAVGLTDTDDATEALRDGQPVRAVFLDQSSVDGTPVGTLILPNTVSLIARGPNPDGAKRVFDYLLSARVQLMLAESCAQAPLSPGVTPPDMEFDLSGVVPMKVDYGSTAARLDAVMPQLKAWLESV